MENKPVRFRVRYKFEINGHESEGIEEEASWFYLDQRGNFYSNGPMSPIKPCGREYKELIPLLKVNDEYLTINEIEKKINDLQKFHDMFIKHNITDDETSVPNREVLECAKFNDDHEIDINEVDFSFGHPNQLGDFPCQCRGPMEASSDKPDTCVHCGGHDY
jgi:hypothetical protein